MKSRPVRFVLLIALTVVTGTTATAHTTHCVDYTGFAHWSGGLDTPGSARQVAVSGTLGYVADGGAGLTIVDVADPAAPFLVSTTPIPGSPVDVAVVGDFAYLACGSVGLVTVDVSDPDNPVVTQTSPVTGIANAVGSRDGFLYLASVRVGVDGRLNVFDISFPSDPLLRGVVWTPSEPRKLIVQGSIVYITHEQCFEFGCIGGLGSFDVSDPDNPAELSYLGFGPVIGGDVQRNFGYVCSDIHGLLIVDTSDPDDMRFLQNFPAIQARDIRVFRGRAYMAVEGLQIGTVFAGGDVREIIDIPTPPLGRARRIVLDGDRTYLLDNGTLQIVSLQTLETVPEMGNYPTKGVARDLEVQDGVAYMAVAETGVHILDVSDPAAPTHLSSTATSGPAWDVAVVGDHAYVAVDAAGLTILDVSDPAAPSVVGSAKSAGPARAIAVDPPYAYVADHGGATSRGLRVFNVSDPTTPFPVAWISLPDDAQDIAINGTTAILTLGEAGLGRIDISDPESPTVQSIFSVGPSGTARAFGFAPGTNSLGGDGYGVVTGDDLGIKVINLAGSGSIIASLPLPGNGRSVGRIGDTVAVGTDEGQVILVSLERPAAPRIVGGINARGIVHGIEGGEVLYLAQGEAGFGIFPGPCGAAVAVGESGVIPIRLLVNVPNPFRPSTRIPYVVDGSATVSLRVFDASGRLTRTLINDVARTPGAYEAVWDGRDDTGRTTPAGVYFFRLRSGSQSVSGKALRLP